MNRLEAERNLGLGAVADDLDHLSFQPVGIIDVDADKRGRRTLILGDAQNKIINSSNLGHA